MFRNLYKSFKVYLTSYLQSIAGAPQLRLELQSLAEKVEEGKILSARILINQMKAAGTLPRISDAEFKVFSQFGDDGIIQYLIHQVVISDKESVFVEFGVQNYQESNTRFLLTNNNWRGLVIDGGEENIQYIRNTNLFWKHDLRALCAFITRENINDLIASEGVMGEIGLLSIDIDGMDYWVWENINVINPIIVVVEYNSVFGKDFAVTVPYDAKFYRGNAHYSNLYWGASIKALEILAKKKGYILVGSNSAGNNVYFVRKDRCRLLERAVEDVYEESKFRESRDESKSLTYINGKDRLLQIKDMPIFCIQQNRELSITELFGLK